MALDDAAGFVYRTLLKPRPLRLAANRLLLLLPKKIRLPEGMLMLNPEDPVISGALALGVYERFEMTLFRAVLEEGARVLDVGANVGVYTVIAASRVGPRGSVIACEPEPANFSLLSKNISANGFANVQARDVALADAEGSMQLHLSSSNKGHHTLVALSGAAGDFERSISVRVTTGDSLLRGAGADIVKIDIEGAEPLALKGLAQTLMQPELALFMEYSPRAIEALGHAPEEVLNDLVAKGFAMFDIDGRKRRLIPLKDTAAFARRFEGAAYTNLLCVKGRFSERVKNYV
jgi:FkbM family methyltransferase